MARVDRYLGDLLNEQSFAKQEDLHFIVHSGTRPVNGFHTEHIFANNEKIMEQFLDENNEFDEKLFNDERNRLGALLLLKGNENIRMSNNPYKDKMNSYSNSGFIWNRILTGAINKASLHSSNHPLISDFCSYTPNQDGLLERTAIDERQLLLFKIIREIYKNN